MSCMPFGMRRVFDMRWQPPDILIAVCASMDWPLSSGRNVCTWSILPDVRLISTTIVEPDTRMTAQLAHSCLNMIVITLCAAYVTDVRSGARLFTLQDTDVENAQWSHDDTRIALCIGSIHICRVQIWDVSTRTKTNDVFIGGVPRWCAFSSNGTRFATPTRKDGFEIHVEVWVRNESRVRFPGILGFVQSSKQYLQTRAYPAWHI